MRETIQVFEYGTLQVGQSQGLCDRRFESLVRFSERTGGRYFTVGYQRLHFCNYVGVIQVGGLTIEVLPKTEREADADRGKWQRALVEMMRGAGYFNPEPLRHARVRTRRMSLFDLYIEAFLDEVERVFHGGLARKYRVAEGNLNKLKGRLILSRHLRCNAVHRERMYTAHQVYDRDNVFNRILKLGIEVVAGMAGPSLSARARAVALAFEEIGDVRPSERLFERLRFDRSTERYRQAIELARLLILNYCPDVRVGGQDVLALLFDMNALFERFVLVQMKRAAPTYSSLGLHVAGQASRPFWENRSVRPDILATWQEQGRDRRVILDTKWKIPTDGRPADADLQQMFLYNVHFGAARSILIYPASGRSRPTEGAYRPSAMLPGDARHTCETYFAELFDEDQRLRKDIGQRIITDILGTCSAS